MKMSQFNEQKKSGKIYLLHEKFLNSLEKAFYELLKSDNWDISNTITQNIKVIARKISSECCEQIRLLYN